MGFNQKRVLPEPLPPTIRTFLFRAVFVESAVLVEDHYNEICDELWYIYVEDAVRRNRLYYSRGYDNKKIDEIIAAQLPKEMFLKACDRVIDNSGIFAETMIQIDQIVKEL